ncbi:MAG: hypothetical protein ACRDFA_08935 [bacterium]
MSLSDVIRKNFRRSIGLYEELVTELPEAALAMKLPGVPSNSIGHQLWCVVGARESYSRAIQAGRWSGFSSSLTSEGTREKTAVQRALTSSADAVLSVLSDMESYDDDRNRFVADLLEHEAAHHGQLIRYLYGLKLPVPAGWKAKYALE